MIKKFVKKETGRLIATLDDYVYGYRLQFLESCHSYTFTADNDEEAVAIARALVRLHTVNDLRFTGIK